MIAEAGPSRLKGSINIPASKSHSIRALLIATLADGTSTLTNLLDSADVRSCMEACRALGARITSENGTFTVVGTGGKLTAPQDPIDVGNSGTTIYLIASLAGLTDKPITFDGDEQIRNRSAANLLNALSELGANVKSSERGCAPFTISGPAAGGEISIECPTSQYLSSLLLAAPLFNGETIINVPLLNEQPYAEITLRWLDEQGIRYTNENFKRFIIPGGQKYKAFNKAIPADFSSGTFFLCAAAITGSELTLNGLDMTDSQGDKDVVHMLEKLGCETEIGADYITIKGRPMKGCTLDLNATPDALPALAVTACYAEGETHLANVPQARMKETDRIDVMTKELRKMGAHIDELEDGMIIRKSKLTGTDVKGHGDHRVVMSLAIAALGASGVNRIDTAEAVDITFPGFFELLNKLRA
ncbi:3-phosphoshikimate 1-carboxyvinyltransferase [Spirochaeta isovalerica]|uniref:3-phosphoshikimate 1-carboxyvinyltransferase n=1 Tax=Spirochaeta isovalerica TaxID=150 RepID=A0A841RHB1_9SPIO|nr:3-phosphoshikimate 1-carboxyvinyltransferase [Spirochaeta isovalerica]MBB6482400.1 3-phosphoshikimate 1-carboxyvinyltransferase [Spirochaeta isovalerica]